MGTLTNQTPRADRLTSSRVVSIGMNVRDVSRVLEISFKDALDLCSFIAQMDEYDTKDEQLAGLGELLKELIEK